MSDDYLIVTIDDLVPLIDSINNKSCLGWITSHINSKIGNKRYTFLIKLNELLSQYNTQLFRITIIDLYSPVPLIFINGLFIELSYNDLILTTLEDYFQKPIQDLF